MLTKDDALARVLAELERRNPNVCLVVLQEHTIERPFEWVFFLKLGEIH
jgi:hypothetical protein